jgi:hypothetical protein
MVKSGLDLEAIFQLQRSSRSRASSTPEPAWPWSPRVDPLQVSRRGFLGLAGLATAQTLPLHQAGPWLESFRVDRGDGHIAFKVGGCERWRLDVRRYAGNPRLQVEESPWRIAFQLDGARLPGTRLPADLAAVLAPVAGRWWLNLRLALGDLSVSLPFVPWLLGEIAAGGPVDLAGWAVGRRGGPGLRLAGGACRMDYRPDGSFRLAGAACAELVTPRLTAVADEVELALPEERLPSLFAEPPGRRTIVPLYRLGGSAQVDLAPAGGPAWRLDPWPCGRLVLEAGESASGDREWALLASPASGDGAPRLHFDHLAGLAGEGLDLRLEEARLALRFGARGEEECALTGSLGPAPFWVSTSDLGLLLGQDESRAGFVARFAGGRQVSVRCAAVLLDVAAPLDGGLVQAARLPDLARVDLLREGEAPAAGEAIAAVSPAGETWLALGSLALDLVRPEDLLVLRIESENLLLRARKGCLFGESRHLELVPADPLRPAYLAVLFPPQHIVEEAFFEAESARETEPVTAAPVRSLISDPSRLVFRLPEGAAPVPFTFESLLDWSRLEQCVAPNAVAREETASGTPRAPEPRETAIEFPFRLILSPNDRAGWLHSPRPVGFLAELAGGRGEAVLWTELWHTQLAVRSPSGLLDPGNRHLRTVRAIWSRDRVLPNGQIPDVCTPPRKDPGAADAFRMAMGAGDRYEIVDLSANFSLAVAPTPLDPNPSPPLYEPLPIQVERLSLSSLGAWASLEGSWTPVNSLSVKNWRHEAAMGRDQYVRVVYGGFLFPYRHPSSLVQITERKFEKSPDGFVTAYLRQRVFITCDEPYLTYGETGLVDGDERSIDRMMPFRSLRVTTLVTPNLDPPEHSSIEVPGEGSLGKCAFFPRVDRQNYLFHFEAVDLEGKSSEFDAPVVFVMIGRVSRQAVVDAVSHAFDGAEDVAERAMHGQSVAYAPARLPGETAYETHTLTFAGHSAFELKSTLPPPAPVAELRLAALAPPPPPAADDLPCVKVTRKPKVATWHPKVTRAKVRVPAVSQMTGSDKKVPIEWDDTYLRKGFDLSLPQPNKGELFARVPSGLDFRLPPIGSIGLIKPDFDVTGLSRKFGSVGGDLDELIKGLFHGDRLFDPSALTAKILGVFDLGRVLLPQIDLDARGPEHMPRVATRILYDGRGIPNGAEASMTWRTDLHPFDAGLVKLQPKPGGGLGLELVTRTLLSAPSPTRALTGRLHDFDVEIAEAIRVEFDSLTFSSQGADKPDVTCKIQKIEFLGALAFIAELQKSLLKDLFGGNGPTLEITPESVVAGIGFTLPDTTVGALTLMNLRLSARLTLPLSGDRPLRLRFAFGEPHDRFLVAATIFGGGGFVNLALGGDGIESLDAALEFGGVFALSIPFAQGTVYLFAGIRFFYDRAGAQITGYVRCGGALNILGFVTMSVEFFAGVRYEAASGTIVATASVTVHVGIGPFGQDVSLPFERRFAGSSSQQAQATLVAALHPDAAAGTPAPAAPGIGGARFRDLYERRDWDAYCAAFGDEG